MYFGLSRPPSPKTTMAHIPNGLVSEEDITTVGRHKDRIDYPGPPILLLLRRLQRASRSMVSSEKDTTTQTAPARLLSRPQSTTSNIGRKDTGNTQSPPAEPTSPASNKTSSTSILFSPRRNHAPSADHSASAV
ncbi:hypothetical protein CDD83_10014 [Cordyceps sp. RAO-2017]|nr:hypothetical protein CDD83_10014 [Cordyceps sp. RAO-2017]